MMVSTVFPSAVRARHDPFILENFIKNWERNREGHVAVQDFDLARKMWEQQAQPDFHLRLRTYMKSLQCPPYRKTLSKVRKVLRGKFTIKLNMTPKDPDLAGLVCREGEVHIGSSMMNNWDKFVITALHELFHLAEPRTLHSHDPTPQGFTQKIPIAEWYAVRTRHYQPRILNSFRPVFERSRGGEVWIADAKRLKLVGYEREFVCSDYK